MDAILKQLYEDLAIRGVSMVRIDQNHFDGVVVKHWPYKVMPVNPITDFKPNPDQQKPPKREKLNITAIRDLPRLDPNIYGSRERVLNHIMKKYNALFNSKKD